MKRRLRSDLIDGTIQEYVKHFGMSTEQSMLEEDIKNFVDLFTASVGLCYNAIPARNCRIMSTNGIGWERAQHSKETYAWGVLPQLTSDIGVLLLGVLDDKEEMDCTGNKVAQDDPLRVPMGKRSLFQDALVDCWDRSDRATTWFGCSTVQYSGFIVDSSTLGKQSESEPTFTWKWAIMNF